MNFPDVDETGRNHSRKLAGVIRLIKLPRADARANPRNRPHRGRLATMRRRAREPKALIDQEERMQANDIEQEEHLASGEARAAAAPDRTATRGASCRGASGSIWARRYW